MTAVTVLIPVYGGRRTIVATMESVLAQTFTDFEILVIDDASPDGAWSEIERIAARDPRIRAVRHPANRGLAATLNEGLALARAPLVARLDQDDEALPQRLERQVAFMAANPAVVAAGSFVRHMGRTPARDRLVELPVDHDAITAVLPQYNCFYHPAIILRRDTVLAAGGYQPAFKNAEDYELWLRLSRHYRLANIPEPLIRYRFSLDGMSLGRKWEQLLYVYMAQAAFIQPGADPDALREQAEARLKTTDRGDFMTQVAAGTIRELLRLGLWPDALRLLWRYRREADPIRVLRVLRALERS